MQESDVHVRIQNRPSNVLIADLQDSVRKTQIEGFESQSEAEFIYFSQIFFHFGGSKLVFNIS